MQCNIICGFPQTVSLLYKSFVWLTLCPCTGLWWQWPQVIQSQSPTKEISPSNFTDTSFHRFSLWYNRFFVDFLQWLAKQRNWFQSNGLCTINTLVGIALPVCKSPERNNARITDIKVRWTGGKSYFLTNTLLGDQWPFFPRGI